MKNKNAKFESIFHFDRLFTKLIFINANGAGSLRLSRNYRAQTLSQDIREVSLHVFNDVYV